MLFDWFLLGAMLGAEKNKRIFSGCDSVKTHPAKEKAYFLDEDESKDSTPAPAPEPPAPLPKEKMVGQLALLLKSEAAARGYCDEVASLLLEKGKCVFNAPEAIKENPKAKANPDEWEKEYFTPEWKEAWAEAIKTELSIKSAIYAPEKGVGCFMLEAI